MEHPTGKFDTALEAMADAVARLRKLRNWEKWICFSAQGEGDSPDSQAFVEVRMLGNNLDVGDKPLDVTRIIHKARTSPSSLVADGSNYSVAGATPREVAQIFDAIFRHHLGLRPFGDEEDDYAVGAEWKN